MSVHSSQRLAQPREKLIAKSFIALTAALFTAAFVTFNMHERDDLLLWVFLAGSTGTFIAAIVLSIVIQVRGVKSRNAMDRYVGMIARAKREEEKATVARIERWERERAQPIPAHPELPEES